MNNIIFTSFNKKEFKILSIILFIISILLTILIILNNYITFYHDEVIGHKFRNRLVIVNYDNKNDIDFLMNSNLVEKYYITYADMYYSIDEEKTYSLSTITPDNMDMFNGESSLNNEKTLVSSQAELYLNINNNLLKLEIDKKEYELIIDNNFFYQYPLVIIPDSFRKQIADERGENPAQIYFLLNKYKDKNKIPENGNYIFDATGNEELNIIEKTGKITRIITYVIMIIVLLILNHIINNYILQEKENNQLYKWIGYNNKKITISMIIRLIITELTSLTIILFIYLLVINVINNNYFNYLKESFFIINILKILLIKIGIEITIMIPKMHKELRE